MSSTTTTAATAATTAKELKIVVVGSYNVGKTSFVNLVTKQSADRKLTRSTQHSKSTSCPDYYYDRSGLTFIDCDDPCSFVETAHEKADYWANVNWAIIMVDYNSPNTLRDIQKYATKVRDAFPGIPMVVVYNKIDLNVLGNAAPSEMFPIEGFPEIKEYFELSVTSKNQVTIEYHKHRCDHVLRFIYHHMVHGGTKRNIHMSERESIVELERSMSRLERHVAHLSAELKRVAGLLPTPQQQQQQEDAAACVASV